MVSWSVTRRDFCPLLMISLTQTVALTRRGLAVCVSGALWPRVALPQFA